MATKRELITWTNYQRDLSESFKSLLITKELTDVTLSCEEQKILAHKFLLAASSPFFEEIFAENPCEHPVIVLKNVRYVDLFNVILYIYQGCVSIEAKQVESFLKTADLLEVPIKNRARASYSKNASSLSNEHLVVLRSGKEEHDDDEEEEKDGESDDSFFEGIFEEDAALSNVGTRNERKLPTIELKNIKSNKIVVTKDRHMETKTKKELLKEAIDSVTAKVNKPMSSRHPPNGKASKQNLDFLRSLTSRKGGTSIGTVREVDTTSFLTQIRKMNESGSNNSISTGQQSSESRRRSSNPNVCYSDHSSSTYYAYRRHERKFREAERKVSGNDYGANERQSQKAGESDRRRRRGKRGSVRSEAKDGSADAAAGASQFASEGGQAGGGARADDRGRERRERRKNKESGNKEKVDLDAGINFYR